ncbi:signal transduction histidine kinase [Natranaerovirga pectinivora]|uniref:histidine kinase n=1 Tax=Natranaerovirga pectinivora TaxID=682400 RepID=A0A4R3MQV5_9FIRM|nr:HAMP domain-containing sensor histidine kinase [Natranaerovirga pectinivora]TCT16296.1 signal transduction histidine kinase [Natranaerovirga pectinivora]
MRNDNKTKSPKNDDTNAFTGTIQRVFNNISSAVSGIVNGFISNLRFSISLRISLIYIRLLLFSLIFIIFLYCIGFLVIMVPIIHREDQVLYSEIAMGISREEDIDNVVMPLRNVTKKEIVIFTQNNLIYTTVEDEKLYTVNRLHFDRTSRTLYYLNAINEDDIQITIIHSLNKYLSILSNIIKVILIIELLRIFSIIKKGRKINKKVLKPIMEMTEIAQRISVQNLSHRINVAGTKNELKDLAKTINDMMDRIETSYNNQKQFVSDASHELRTPIAVIQGYANLLNRWGKEDKEVLNESIIAIKNESNNMQELVEKLLYLARHDKKTLKLEKELFELKDLLNEMIRETKMIAKSHIIESEINCSPIIYGDKQSIKQGIRIFIDNALKYTEPGGKITIKCETENDGCLVSIIDTGIGISKKDLNKIFSRFYRADESRNNNKNGHGLGLSIAKLIVLAHNGKIKVKSKLGEGSVFTIYFDVENGTN